MNHPRGNLVVQSLISLVLVIGLGISVYTFNHYRPVVLGSSVAKNLTVSLVIDSKIRTSDYIASQSALAQLQSSGVPISIKSYSFGTLVESINTVKNTKDKSWIYFVNGASASVGADKYILSPGDTIEWKYIKPQF
jgi:hypothetical protein